MLSVVHNYNYIFALLLIHSLTPLEFFFQEQSYSSLHSGRSLAWDHVRGDIDNPCGAIVDFCGVVAIPEAIGGRTVADAAMPIVARHAKHHKTSWNTSKALWYIVKHREPLVKHHETLLTLWNIMKHSSFGATISALDAETSALDVETSAFGAATSAISRRSFDATISALHAETSAIARSYRRYRRGVFANIGDCGVGITPQMCNRVTNHGDISTFSKPAVWEHQCVC